MLFLHITAKAQNAHVLNKYVAEGKHAFALVYMDGCGPCNATRPEWAKLKSTIQNKYKNYDNVVIADINSDALKDIHDIKNVQGFPTIIFIRDKGQKKEEFENGKQLNKSRTVDAFIEWIELNLPAVSSKLQKMEKTHKPKSLHKLSVKSKKYRGGSYKRASKRSNKTKKYKRR
jgi:thiol-disulfide isomerase/thioredoxin